jgi:hypothetical protein
VFDADDWLKTVIKKLETTQCTDREMVLYTTGRLEGLAFDWWDVYTVAHATVGVLDRQPTKGSTEVDECGLTGIGNSKEETRGTQFRQVRAVRCVIPYVLYAA